MPLVRIDLSADRTIDQRRAIANVAHRAMIDTLKIPPDDRFQLLTLHGADDWFVDPQFLGITRHNPVVVHVTCRNGRSDEQKRAFYADLATGLDALGVSGDDLVVTISENTPIDWSFGRGLASYAPAR